MWIALAVAGTIAPYAAFVPWVADHGLAPSRFLDEMFANPIASFFAIDVLVSALAVVVLVLAQRASAGRWWWLPLVGLVAVGVSLALPLAMLVRGSDRSREAA